MKKFVRAVAIAILIGVSALAYGVEFRRAQPNLDDVFGASCRVSVEGARGSGLFVYYNGAKAYVLTNFHVVQNSATATLDFWTNHARQSVRGKVIKRFSDRRANLDFAIIEVDANELKKIDPPYIPLAPVDPSSLTGRKIYAAGGPKGWFVQTWKGANESIADGLVLFSPHPVPGQSGSGVCTIIDGQIYAVEVLTYLLGDENSDASKGGALPVLYLANALKGVRHDFGDALNLNARPIPVADTTTGDLAILAFTTDDCNACDVGEEGLKAYEDTGGIVKRVDPNKPENSNLAVAYNVTETPTYFVVDANNEPLLRISYDDIKREGAIAAVRVGIASATPKPAPKEEAKPEPVKKAKVKPAPKPVEPPQTPVSEPVRLDSDHGVVISEAGEPKKTLPVYVTDPKEYELDLRQPVYDDASETVALDLFSNWRERGGNDYREPEEPTAPPTPTDPERARIGDRLAEQLANALAPKIDRSVNNAAATISQNIGTALTDDDSPLSEVRRKVETSVKGFLFKLAVIQILLFIGALAFCYMAWSFIKKLWRGFLDMARDVNAFKENNNNGTR